MFDMNHLHPMIVHFPIALIIVGFAAEIAGLLVKKDFFTTVATWMLIFGTLGTIAAYLTGNLAGDGIAETGMLEQAIEQHEDAALLTLWVLIGASVVRLAMIFLKQQTHALRFAGTALFLVGVLAVARTGYYGGNLVYKHAAGVQINLGFDFSQPLDNNNFQLGNGSADEDEDD